MVEIQAVTFEHHRESLGIGESEPRISWRFSGKARNWTQSSYVIEIRRPLDDPQKQRIFRVKSSQSVLVPWPTMPLQSREIAHVRVKVTGFSESESTPWSETATVEAGLLTHADWTAVLITAERIFSPNKSLRPLLFRKTFQLPAISKARLYITSFGLYEANINGSRVGNHVLSPGWTSYKHNHNYQTFDVTHLLAEGDNAIGVQVAEGWFCGRLGFNGGRRNVYGDRLALLAQLEVVFDDGELLSISSDETWRTSVGPILSSEIYDGETYDACLEVPEWSSPSFDDEDWSLVEQMDFPRANLKAPAGPPIRKLETFPPQKVFRSPTGKVIVDFAQNLVGWVRVRVDGRPGHKIVFTHTEVLENGECATRPLRECKSTDSLTLSGGFIEWEPRFTFHGFRYVQIDGWPSDSGEPSLSEIAAVVIHTDMERTGWFQCSDQMVNKLHENIRWGMRGNFVSIPTDCPQRDERLGWTGDIQIFAPTANFLYNTCGMLLGWLRDLTLEQLESEGCIPPLVCPDVLLGPRTPQAVWSDAIIITPWDMYKSFGDQRILLQQYLSMQTWLGQGIPRHANGLWDPAIPQLGDWLDPNAPPNKPGSGRTDPHLVANAFLVHVTDLFSQVSHVLGKKDVAIQYFEEGKRLKKQFQDEYVTPNGRLVSDSMTAISLAIQFSLFAHDQQQEDAALRLGRIVKEANFKIATGFVGTSLICPALTKSGQSQLAYRMLLEQKCPSWLYPITMGATTMWERWDSMMPDGTINPGKMTSFNHYALGSVGNWLHGIVGGITPIEPGWKSIRFEPIPGGTLTEASVRHLSPYGVIESRWKIDSGIFVLQAVVPPNTTAKVKLPGRNDVLEVGSGVHNFRVRYEPLPWPPSAIESPFSQDDGND